MKLSYLGIVIFTVAAVKLLLLDAPILFQQQPVTQHEPADLPCLPIDSRYHRRHHEESSRPTTTTAAKSNLFLLHNQQAKATDRSIIDQEVVGGTSACSDQLREIFQRHDCLLQTMNGGRYPGEETFSKRYYCHDVGLAAAPLYHLSFMHGQGFGRILQHGVKTCLLAALLHRPCVMDLIRDPYYNLRSYIQAGPYDWDLAARAVISSHHAVNISRALQQMPQGIEKGHGWETPSSSTQQKQNNGSNEMAVPEYDNVLPMVWGSEKSSPEAVQRHLDLWDGQPSVDDAVAPSHSHHNKILLSPNFGDAWYAYGKEYISVHKEWNRRFMKNTNNADDDDDDDYYCDANHMTTLLQNLMFTPTSLAYELYHERRAVVLQEQELIEQQRQQRQQRQQQQRDLRNKRILQQALTWSSLPPYGAIHLRMNILNRDVYKMGVTKEQVVEGLRDCFKKLTLSSYNNNNDNSNNDNSNSDDSSRSDIPDKWWLISDDVQVAAHVAEALPNVYSYASVVSKEQEKHGRHTNSNATTPTAASDTIIRQKVKGVHSGNAMNQKFGQAELAASVLDWMALHESHIALITHDSAYGETGARGSGKVRSSSSSNNNMTCGGILQNKRRSFPMFSVFRKE